MTLFGQLSELIDSQLGEVVFELGLVGGRTLLVEFGVVGEILGGFWDVLQEFFYELLSGVDLEGVVGLRLLLEGADVAIANGFTT